LKGRKSYGEKADFEKENFANIPKVPKRKAVS